MCCWAKAAWLEHHNSECWSKQQCGWAHCSHQWSRSSSSKNHSANTCGQMKRALRGHHRIAVRLALRLNTQTHVTLYGVCVVCRATWCARVGMASGGSGRGAGGSKTTAQASWHMCAWRAGPSVGSPRWGWQCVSRVVLVGCGRGSELSELGTTLHKSPSKQQKMQSFLY